MALCGKSWFGEHGINDRCRRDACPWLGLRHCHQDLSTVQKLFGGNEVDEKCFAWEFRLTRRLSKARFSSSLLVYLGSYLPLQIHNDCALIPWEVVRSVAIKRHEPSGRLMPKEPSEPDKASLFVPRFQTWSSKVTD